MKSRPFPRTLGELGADRRGNFAVTCRLCASPAANGITCFRSGSTGEELNSVYQEIASMIRRLRLVS